MMTGLEVPRLWFVSEDTRDLVQIQLDRVSQNWRRIEPFDVSVEYPGYRAIRERFAQSFTALAAWTERFGISALPLQVAELSYVNAIPMPRSGELARLSDVLAFYKGADQPVQVAGFQTAWIEPNPQWRGAVQVNAGIQPLPDGQPAVALTLDGRADVAGSSLDEALQRFDLMHDKIHEVFDRVVNPDLVQGYKR